MTNSFTVVRKKKGKGNCDRETSSAMVLKESSFAVKHWRNGIHRVKFTVKALEFIE